jgi:DNA-directed RNA polymerase alpha subunit
MGFDLMTIFLLQSNDIKTLDDLLNKYRYDILSINGIKKENYEEIITKLEFFDLSLKSKKGRIGRGKCGRWCWCSGKSGPCRH